VPEESEEKERKRPYSSITARKTEKRTRPETHRIEGETEQRAEIPFKVGRKRAVVQVGPPKKKEKKKKYGEKKTSATRKKRTILSAKKLLNRRLGEQIKSGGDRKVGLRKLPVEARRKPGQNLLTLTKEKGTKCKKQHKKAPHLKQVSRKGGQEGDTKTVKNPTYASTGKKATQKGDQEKLGDPRWRRGKTKNGSKSIGSQKSPNNVGKEKRHKQTSPNCKKKRSTLEGGIG